MMGFKVIRDNIDPADVLLGVLLGIGLALLFGVVQLSPVEPSLSDYRKVTNCESILRATNRLPDLLECLDNYGLKIVKAD